MSKTTPTTQPSPTRHTPEQTLFTTWTFAGVKYLAVRRLDENWHITNSAGGNYGSWFTVDGFRKLQRAGDDSCKPFEDTTVAELCFRITATGGGA